jgi:hypothetical protein
LLCEDHLVPEAGTVSEHLRAFHSYSQLPVYQVNVALGFPPSLRDVEFAVTLFHYSLRPTGTWITPEIDAYLTKATRTHKVAIFQDEVYYFKERLDFLNRYQVDCLYTRHKPRHWDEVYGRATRLKKRIFYMAGYVAPELLESASKHYVPLEARPIDVGYRGRRLPYYLGRAALEKSEIGEKFPAFAAHSGLTLDIGTEENERHYGEAWHRFLAGCKAVLGVQGGVSVIDLEDTFREQYYALIKNRPDLSFDEFAQLMGDRFTQLENRIDYRAFTPRHFESAAFRNVQVLFEGRYDGLMSPGVHYIPLCRDFSNVADVLAQLRSLDRMHALTERAWQDLIGSGRYTYESFIRSFDAELEQAGIRFEKVDRSLEARLRTALDDWTTFRQDCYRVLRAIQSAYQKHPELSERIIAAQGMLEAYVQCRPFDPLFETRHPDLRALQAQDRELWTRLSRVARCDLDFCLYAPSIVQKLQEHTADSLYFGWRVLRKLARMGRRVATGWRKSA